jgi:hypothetical protein
MQEGASVWASRSGMPSNLTPDHRRAFFWVTCLKATRRIRVGFRNWLRRFFQPKDVPSVLEGFTDDLSVQLRADRTIEQLVDYILAANEQQRSTKC